MTPDVHEPHRPTHGSTLRVMREPYTPNPFTQPTQTPWKSPVAVQPSPIYPTPLPNHALPDPPRIPNRHCLSAHTYSITAPDISRLALLRPLEHARLPAV